MEVRLEQWPKDGMSAMQELYAQVDQSCCFVQLPVPLPEDKTVSYLKAIYSGDNQGRAFLCRAITADERVIGKIELTKSDSGAAELDIVIRRDKCKQGAGESALKQLMQEAGNTRWCRRITAYVCRDNTAALRLLSKCGFRTGRRFTADVMQEVNGTYRLTSRPGIEMVYDYTGTL